MGCGRRGGEVCSAGCGLRLDCISFWLRVGISGLDIGYGKVNGA